MQHTRDNADRLLALLDIAEKAQSSEEAMAALRRAEVLVHDIQRDIASVKALLLMLPGETEQ